MGVLWVLFRGLWLFIGSFFVVESFVIVINNEPTQTIMVMSTLFLSTGIFTIYSALTE